MSLSRRDALFAGSAALPASALFLAAARAQTPTPAQPAAPPDAATAPGTNAPAQNPGEDPLLASCLLIIGAKQIAVCRFALERAKTDEAKSFAQAEIDEHVGIKEQLARFGFAPPEPAPMPQTAPALPAGVANMRPLMVGKVVLPPGASALVQVDREVAEQCVTTTQATLKKREAEKGGMKMDKAFLGMQLHEHYGLLDRADVFTRHASAPMQEVLKAGREVIVRHIATLEGLMEKFDAMARKDG